MIQNKFLVLFLTAIFVIGCTQVPPLGEIPGGNSHEEYHAHADFLAALDGTAFDFNKAEFMSTPYKELSEKIHLHDFNPNVIHVHDENATLGDFFTSLGMKFDKNCFDTGTQKYCSDNQKKPQFFVNGQLNSQFENYKIQDLDKILIYFGEGAPSQELFGKITNMACIYSEKCEPPPGFIVVPENCSASKPCELPK